MIKRAASARVGRAARTDATVGTMEKKIANHFKLPAEAVKLVRPDGRKFRSDATVASVLSTWDKNG